ncbi:acetylxylan esterase [Verticillium alfalfae VaMs.102]|uniref:Acetylxylan esterase n=1 Tax=Verticillium alfalfae (strain VaMs.102 / ATCC MYA-4576 / FGSC 10136) TaxID=526221 RepID=C9SSL6_VERA1|nr:acetylxylan esterase [Verticillium alfalfae VaMs.102]EEY21781.1 acetylxylan esterase [Verticillium alfalfae VaMs.102]
MLLLGATILLLGQAAASPMEVTARQANCPPIHVFGARETTVSPGFGSAGTVVNSIIQANPGTTSEAIVYPACGGQASCGGVQYADSARQGTAAVATAVNAFNQRCPDSQIILVGYSQGGQIMDNAYCGGGDTSAGITDTSIPISASAQQMIRAAIMMGSPRFVAGQSQNVGDCLAQGFAARPASFQCPFAANIQSYCDAPDPFCCNGNDAVRHQQYGTIFGAEALTFVNSKSIGNWQHWRSFDLHYITLTSGGTTVDYTIGRNISIPDGESSFTWNPSSILEGLNDSGNGDLWLEDGEEHYFEARIKNMGRWGATTVPSEKSESRVRNEEKCFSEHISV